MEVTLFVKDLKARLLPAVIGARRAAADRSDHTLGERVSAMGSVVRENLGDAHALCPSPKLAAVCGRRCCAVLDKALAWS